MADTLSRVPSVNSNLVGGTKCLGYQVSDLELTAISYPYFGWMDDIRRSSENDDWIMEKVKVVFDSSKLENDNVAVSYYTVDNGFLLYKNRIVLSPTLPWRNKIIAEYHSTLE